MAKQNKKLSDISKVDLYSKSLDQTRTFEIGLASRMLNHSTGDWKLPGNSLFIIDENNGISLKSNSGDSKESKE